VAYAVPWFYFDCPFDAHLSDDRCHLRLLLRGVRKDKRIRMDIPEMRFEPAILRNDEVAVRAWGIDHVALLEGLERGNSMIEVGQVGRGLRALAAKGVE
jgi:hypothetical protein